jgi:hypothetical protein
VGKLKPKSLGVHRAPEADCQRMVVGVGRCRCLLPELLRMKGESRDIPRWPPSIGHSLNKIKCLIEAHAGSGGIAATSRSDGGRRWPDEHPPHSWYLVKWE